MEREEKIRVYVRIVQGRTVCICRASSKRCELPCEKTIVTRDRYEGWQQTMRRDRYGH